MAQKAWTAAKARQKEMYTRKEWDEPKILGTLEEQRRSTQKVAELRKTPSCGTDHKAVFSRHSDEQKRKKANAQNKHQKLEAFTTMERKRRGTEDRLERLTRHSGNYRNNSRD